MAVAQNRPLPLADSTTDGAPGRRGKYGEEYVAPIVNRDMFAGDEGSYFVAITPTPGTGIITHAAPTTFDETKPFLLVYNGSAQRLYPTFLNLHETVAGVGGARLQITLAVDSGNRYSSAGTALTINNVNMDSVIGSGGVSAYIGAVLASAASASRRVLGNYVYRGTIDIIEDDYFMSFGSPDTFSGAAGGRAATVAEVSRQAPPIVVGPGQTLLFHEWRASQSTGPTFEAVLGFVLR